VNRAIQWPSRSISAAHIVAVVARAQRVSLKRMTSARAVSLEKVLLLLFTAFMPATLAEIIRRSFILAAKRGKLGYRL
jgi:hypothetical protein